MVPSYGPTDAKIAIVGEAPGQTEVEYGRPFVGSSGQLLSTMLKDAGILLEQCRLHNVMEIRPPGGDFKKSFYNGSEPSDALIRGKKKLLEKLEKERPNVILALGNEALKALTGYDKLTDCRGIIMDSPVGKVIGTYHPAYILRDYSVRPLAQIDICKVVRESTTRSYEKPRVNFKICPSLDACISYMRSMPSGSKIAFDIETLGRLVRCIAFSSDGSNAICIPFMRVQCSRTDGLVSASIPDRSWWTEPEEKLLLDEMKVFLERPDLFFIAQNGSFDISLLEYNFGITVKNYYFDTMHAHHVCYAELPRGLDTLVSIYTNFPYYWSYDSKSDNSTFTYNCYDAVATWAVAKVLHQELEHLSTKDHNLRSFYFHHKHPLVRSLTRASNIGVQIDVEKRGSISEPLKKELDEIIEKCNIYLSTYGIAGINLGSPKQVLETIIALNYPAPKNKFGKDSTDARAMDSLISRYPNEAFFGFISLYRAKQKFLSTYVEAVLDDDNRFRTSYDASGTETGRISSKKTLWGTGGNLQNIPKRADDPRQAQFRKLFIAAPGWKILHADLSQAEARVVAWISEDDELIHRFLTPGFDIHSYVASARVYHIPLDQVTKALRSKAKACVHSGNYGIGPKTFSYISGIPFNEAKKALGAYQSNPSLQLWWEGVRLELQKSRTLWTPFHRRRTFYGRLDEHTFREAYGFVPQSTVGDYINCAFYRLDSLLDPSRAKMILQVHDEIDIEVEDSYIEECYNLMLKCLSIPLIFNPKRKDIPPLIIPAEFEIGQNWYDLEPYGA